MVGKMLKSEGYNLRERLNIYAGATAGFVAPIAAMRYIALHNMPDTAKGEAIAWGVCTGLNLACTFFARGVPLLYSTGIGTFCGLLSADYLRGKRLDKVLERRVQENQAINQ